MPLTTRWWRLSLLGIAACVVSLALSARESDDLFGFESSWRAYHRRMLSVSIAMRREANALVQERLLAVVDSLDRAAPSPPQRPGAAAAGAAGGAEVLVVAIDAAGRTALAAVEALARREAATLPAHRHPVRFVILQSPRDSFPRTVSRVGIDAPIARYVHLPERAGAPCTVLLMVRAADTASLGSTLAGANGVLGPCAFVAAFGLPGRGMRAHLDSARWHPAAFWRAADAPGSLPGDSLRFAWSDLANDGVRCLARGDDACARTWRSKWDFDDETQDDEWPRAGTDRRAAVGPFPWYAVHGRTLGVRQRLRLSDLALELGPDRFAALWRSDASVDAAFHQVVGMSEGTWTSRWLSRSYASFVPSPWPIVRELTWWGLVIGVSAALLWQRRERRAS